MVLSQPRTELFYRQIFHYINTTPSTGSIVSAPQKRAQSLWHLFLHPGVLLFLWVCTGNIFKSNISAITNTAYINHNKILFLKFWQRIYSYCIHFIMQLNNEKSNNRNYRHNWACKYNKNAILFGETPFQLQSWQLE